MRRTVNAVLFYLEKNLKKVEEMGRLLIQFSLQCKYNNYIRSKVIKGVLYMRKADLNNLMAGVKLQSKKDNSILEVVGLDKEQGKVILDNGKMYSFSTIYRWFDLAPVEEKTVEEKVVEDKPVEPKFKLGDKVKNGLGQIGEVVSVPHLVSYNGRLVMDGYRVQFTDDDETFVKSYSETYEGLTKVEEPVKPTTTEEKVVVNENHEDHTGEANSKVIEGKNSMDELNNILITHNCYLKKMKQYEAVRSDRTKGTLIYIRVAKEGGYHFDVSQKTWSKLTKDYASWLIENFGACIKDKTRKLYRISCNNLEIFQVLLLTALS